MSKDELSKTAKELVASGKGILAADESFPTIKKRLEKAGIESTKETRRTYRELLFTTPSIKKFLSGAILFDETARQETDGVSFPSYLSKKGIIPGIKVDEGKDPAPSSPKETITKGLEGLNKRLGEYKKMGLFFTKWRAVVLIDESLPTKNVIKENAKKLAEFAKVSQKHGFVPIVEPEVLRDGGHDIKKCEEVTRATLTSVFSELEKENVDLTSMLLKPNMVTAGKESTKKASPKKVAEVTLRVFFRTVPEEVPGIVFLSGGQTPDEATANLNEINKLGKDAPWELSFSFGRALQAEALSIWRGKDENVKMAKKAFYQRAELVSLARQGKYE